MAQYVACMHQGSEIYMSGFYVKDIPFIRAEGERLGLRFVHYKEKHRVIALLPVMFLSTRKRVIDIGQ